SGCGPVSGSGSGTRSRSGSSRSSRPVDASTCSAPAMLATVEGHSADPGGGGGGDDRGEARPRRRDESGGAVLLRDRRDLRGGDRFARQRGEVPARREGAPAGFA